MPENGEPMMGNPTSRRDFLRKSAVVGGVAWAAPAIATIAASPVGAATLYACPACGNCAAEATGLRAAGLTAGVASGSGCQCVADPNLGGGQLGSAAADVVCGRADSATCTASALVTGARIRVAQNAFLEASLLSSCVQCGTGASQVLDLDLVTTNALGVETRTDVVVTGGCNESISLLGGTVVIVLNEQTCNNGTLTVNALRVTAVGVNVIAAQSQAGGANCPCTPCSATPTCAPPQTQLC
jgi:hypothetical protein